MLWALSGEWEENEHVTALKGTVHHPFCAEVHPEGMNQQETISKQFGAKPGRADYIASRLQKKGESKANQRVIETGQEWENLPTRPK